MSQSLLKILKIVLVNWELYPKPINFEIDSSISPVLQILSVPSVFLFFFLGSVLRDWRDRYGKT